ncbi:MAG TPA: hypothetical protein VFV83_06410, partial [Chthoniobacteraceae bacterium]|nr:hypothetical protein [Chthoniobacteraceae bacterium]
MKAVPLIVTGALGLVIGVLAGTVDRGTTAAPSVIEISSPITSKTETRGHLHGGSPSGADDERIVRLFSALQEPLALKKNYELFEALRGLTAGDMPAL